MLITLDWIKELIDSGLDPDETSRRLTMAGLEIEGHETVDGQDVLEVNVTPNRPDCLSMLGIARELAAITGNPVTLPAHEVGEQGTSEFTIEILDPDLCPRYAGRVIKGVKIGPSPDWMRARLDRCGIRSINLVVDITNYALLEFGHPLHAFDLNTLAKATIRVGKAGPGMKFRTLDGVEREMPPETLMILDGNGPVAVAGVMGGAETEVTDSTTDVFLESAYFDPASIRRTSKLLGLSTEASFRFERGTDIIMLEHAMDRAASLMAELAGGKVLSKVDAWPRQLEFKPVSARPARINRILGTSIPVSDIRGLLTSLGMKVEGDDKELLVTPPTHRADIVIEEDIIEEVARLYGFDNIPTAMPVAGIAPTEGVTSLGIRSLKSALRAHGFHEAVNYSFMNTDDLDDLGIPSDDDRRKCVKLMNPLRSEDEHLRTTLLPAIIRNLSHNVSRGTRKVRLFETSRVFIDIGEQLPEEPNRLTAILLEDEGPALYAENVEPFFALKGVLEALSAGLRVEGLSFKPSSEPFLHPGKAADVLAGDKRIGYIGVLSPGIAQSFGIKTKREIAAFEIDHTALMQAAPEKPSYRSVPRYPAIERDIALVIDRAAHSADIISAVRSSENEFVEDVSVFDVYEGKGIPEGKKSLAVNIRYRATERTLTDQEVDAQHEKIVKVLLEKTGGSVRGT